MTVMVMVVVMAMVTVTMTTTMTVTVTMALVGHARPSHAIPDLAFLADVVLETSCLQRRPGRAKNYKRHLRRWQLTHNIH